MLYTPVQVRDKRQEAEQIVCVELARVDGSELPPFTAGAHIDIRLAEQVVRQYSLCNSPLERNRYVIAVLRERDSRGGSRYVHDTLRVGDIVDISPPRNLFELRQANHYILLAGGIGITPIICMAEHLSHVDASFEMHYCARSHARAAFIDRIMASPFASRASVHVGPDDKIDVRQILDGQQEDTYLYACGPRSLVDHAFGVARSFGWAEQRLHREFFTPVSEGISGDTFTVKIASTGVEVEVASGTSIIEALKVVGINVPTSCEQGVCGTCVTRVLDGTPDHRDMFLTDDEHEAGDRMALCCSRALSGTIVLDL